MEPNPGPTVRGRAGSRSASMVARSTSKASLLDDSDNIGSRSPVSDAATRRSQMAGSSNSSINNWLSPDCRRNANATVEPDTDSQEPDMKLMQKEILRGIQQLNSKFDKLEETVNEIKPENIKLRAENEKLREDVTDLSTKLSTVQETLDSTVKKQERLEINSKRKKKL